MKSMIAILCEMVAKSLSDYIRKCDSTVTTRVLRDEQFHVLKQLYNFFSSGKHEGYVELPTGVGKTVLFIEFLKAVNLKAIIVVPTNILVQQTKERILEFAPKLNVGIVNAHQKEYDKMVTITTYASLIAQTKSGKINPSQYKCLILDEAHKALAYQSSATIREFTGAIKIGFTATSDYSDEKRLLNLLPNEIVAMPIRSAIEDGLLSSCSVILVETSVDISSVPSSMDNYRERELALAIDVEGRNMGAVEIYQRFFSGKKAVVYCVGVKHAEKLALMFSEGGVNARAISGKSSPIERRDILRCFSQDTIDILCNADLLIHGFDEKRASVCINLRPTLSWVVATQRAGRVLRLDPDSPDKMAHVVEFVDNYNKRPQQPITFVEVLNDVVILNGLRQSSNMNVSKKHLVDIAPNVDLNGIRVVTNSTHIMKIVRKRRQQRSLKKDWLGALGLQEKLINVFQYLFHGKRITKFGNDFLANVRDLNPRLFQ